MCNSLAIMDPYPYNWVSLEQLFQSFGSYWASFVFQTGQFGLQKQLTLFDMGWNERRKNEKRTVMGKSSFANYPQLIVELIMLELELDKNSTRTQSSSFAALPTTHATTWVDIVVNTSGEPRTHVMAFVCSQGLVDYQSTRDAIRIWVFLTCFQVNWVVILITLTKIE